MPSRQARPADQPPAVRERRGEQEPTQPAMKASIKRKGLAIFKRGCAYVADLRLPKDEAFVFRATVALRKGLQPNKQKRESDNMAPPPIVAACVEQPV